MWTDQPRLSLDKGFSKSTKKEATVVFGHTVEQVPNQRLSLKKDFPLRRRLYAANLALATFTVPSLNPLQLPPNKKVFVIEPSPKIHTPEEYMYLIFNRCKQTKARKTELTLTTEATRRLLGDCCIINCSVIIFRPHTMLKEKHDV